MSNAAARESVLGAIRTSLGVKSEGDGERSKTVEKRLEEHPENLVPERARQGEKARLDLFVSTLEGQSAHVSHAKTLNDVPQIIADYLRDHNLPAEFRCGSDKTINDIPWGKAPSLTRCFGPGQATDTVALSRADTAAAETGTLFLTSGNDNPTTLNFLPDTHMILIRKSDILGSYEDAWGQVRATFGAGNMPRTVNLISGPSRTADIDQIIVMGAHGPRRLHVIIVD